MRQKGEIAAPKTRGELEAMMSRRGELQSQLRAAEERRFQLAVQAQSSGPETRGTLMQRIATLDGRVVQIEKQVQQLDDAISAGLANADINHGADVEVPLVPPGSPTFPGWPAPPTPPGGGFTLLPPGGDPAIPINGRNLMVGGVVTLALFAFTGWLAFRYALARVSRLAGLSGTNASQVSQLQQSVDAIAVEVERISENQRYVTRLLNPQGEQVPANSVIGRRD